MSYTVYMYADFAVRTGLALEPLNIRGGDASIYECALDNCYSCKDSGHNDWVCLLLSTAHVRRSPPCTALRNMPVYRLSKDGKQRLCHQKRV